MSRYLRKIAIIAVSTFAYIGFSDLVLAADAARAAALISTQQYERAFEPLSESAQFGDKSSQYLLGHMLEKGLGDREIDLSRAIYWYCKAAAQGHFYAKRKTEKISCAE